MEAEKYFANILTLYSQQILKKIDEFLKLGWEIAIIAPAHGVCWRQNPTQIVEKYVQWATGEPQKSAVIIFDTIWGGTEKMARAIAEGLEDEGVSYRMFNAGAADLADTMTDLLSCRALVVGCPTRNNKLLPTLALYMEEISGLRFKNKIGMAFGTYGWSGEAVRQVEEALTSMGMELAGSTKTLYVPGGDTLAACHTLGLQVASALQERLAGEPQPA